MSLKDRIRWNCPHCNQLYKSPCQMAGTTISCSQCAAAVEIPVPDNAETNAADETHPAVGPTTGPRSTDQPRRIRWNCPQCDQLYKTVRERVGEQFHCLSCQALIRVPAPESLQLRWSCSHCNLTFQTTPQLAGQIIECPSCHEAIPVPTVRT